MSAYGGYQTKCARAAPRIDGVIERRRNRIAGFIDNRS
jgi:hypothetical protein